MSENLFLLFQEGHIMKLIRLIYTSVTFRIIELILIIVLVIGHTVIRQREGVGKETGKNSESTDNMEELNTPGIPDAEPTFKGEDPQESESGIENETVELFGCEAQKIKRETGEMDVAEIYMDALSEGSQKGYTPVLVEANETLMDHIKNVYEENGGREKYRKKILANEHNNGKKLFKKEYKYWEEEYGEIPEITQEMQEYFTGDPVIVDERNPFPPAYQLEGDLYLVKVPTSFPYNIFAWIPFGGWNSCPDTDDMIAMCKSWYKEYGAAPAFISHDMLYMYVEKPVMDLETAKELAKEHCAFCSDTVVEGSMDISILFILGKRYWSFWWD